MSKPVIKNPLVAVRYPLPPLQRLWLRLVGTGVVLLTEKPLANFVKYYGQLWLLGHWALDHAVLAEQAEEENA